MGLTGLPALYTGTSLDTPAVHELENGTATLFTHAAPDRYSPNQDAAAIIPTQQGGVVLAVADGVGGLPSGDVAARLMVQSLAARVPEAAPGRLRETILDCIEHANDEILALGSGAAATLAVVEIRDGCLRGYHVGDAGVLVTGQRGRRRLQTAPHSPTGYALEAGLIGEQEALNHDERNLVSNVVGSRCLRIEIGPMLRLAPRDTVLVASDGLFDNLLSDEITEYVRCGRLPDAAAALARETLGRMRGQRPDAVSGHADDLSFILFRPAG